MMMTMTDDHDWTQEQIATHIAGGLEPAERERFTKHLAACGECAAKWSEAQSVDKDLNELFEPVRPSPTLEGKVIAALRTAPSPATMSSRRTSFIPAKFQWWQKAVLGAAAAIAVGVMGYVVDGMESGAFDMGVRSERVAKADVPRLRNAVGDEPSGEMGPGYLEGSVTGGNATASSSLTVAGPVELKSAAELARRLKDESVFALESRAREGAATRGLGYTADAEEYAKAKGDTMDHVEADRPAGGRFDRRNQPGPAQDPRPAEPPSSKPYSSYADTTIPPAKAPTNDFYQPGKELEDARKKLEENIKRVEKEEPMPAPKPNPKPETKPDPKKNQDKQDPPQAQRKIIRNGEMEFEVESFDGALGTITKIVAEEGGYIATTNSDKLANGKMRGVVVVRVAPDRLETLVLKMRGIGELKSQKVTSEDVTKQFYDLDSRLRAARTMEARLLEIIKTGKGEIKDLLQVEKELAEWRTKIEEYEGTLRYLTNMVSNSTLTLTLTEKNIRTPATATERENVTMSLEVEDVEKQYNEALKAIGEAKGRVTKSELKKYQADQMQGTVLFEVASDASQALRDRLKQLGIVASLDVDRSTSQTGEGKPTGEVKREDSRYTLSIYNVANISPTETTTASVATMDAEKTYKDVMARVAKAGGRVINSNLNRQRNDQTTGFINFHVKTEEAEAVKNDILAGVEVMRLQLVENPDTRNTTKSKKGFSLSIFALGAVQPREVQNVTLAAGNVVGSYATLQEAVGKAGGRILNANLNEQDKHNVTAFIDYEVRRTELASVEAAMKATGDVYNRTAQRAQDQENVVDSKIRMQLTLINAAAIPARENWTLGIEVGDVDKLMAEVAAMGQLVGRHQSRTPNGQVIARITLNVPLKRTPETVEKIKAMGTLRVMQATKNDQVPDSEISIARLDVTLSNADLIIPSDEGLWKQVKDALYRSFALGMGSLKLIFIGLCVFLPWVGLAWVGWKIAQRMRPAPPPPAAPPAA